MIPMIPRSAIIGAAAKRLTGRTISFQITSTVKVTDQAGIAGSRLPPGPRQRIPLAGLLANFHCLTVRCRALKPANLRIASDEVSNRTAAGV